MGLKIFGGKEIKCDGSIEAVPCKSSFSSYGTNETPEMFVDNAMRIGWTNNPKTGKWFCPKCAERKQPQV